MNIQEKIQELEEKYNIHITTRDSIYEELDLWAENMRSKGYTFIELCNMVNGEVYLSQYSYNDKYNYFILDTISYTHPYVDEYFETIEELEEYLKDNY